MNCPRYIIDWMDASAPPRGLSQTCKAGQVEPVDGKVPSAVTECPQVYIKIFSHRTEGKNLAYCDIKI